jgi:hypothetical protein
MSAEEGWEEPAQGRTQAAEDHMEPHFRSVEDFVSHFLSLVTERRTGGPVVWCPSWWSHPEAVARLTALWRAWEALRLEAATGMSNWWTLHFDPHMRVILDGERGPFAACGRGHQAGKPGPLSLDEPAEGWRSAPLRQRND